MDSFANGVSAESRTESNTHDSTQEKSSQTTIRVYVTCLQFIGNKLNNAHQLTIEHFIQEDSNRPEVTFFSVDAMAILGLQHLYEYKSQHRAGYYHNNLCTMQMFK